MRTLSLRIGALLALASGCYAQIDEPTLVLSRSLPEVPGAPVAGAITLPAIDFSVGDLSVDETDAHSRLSLTSPSVVMTSAGGDDFGGIQSASLRILPPAGSSLEAKTLASYDRSNDGQAQRTLLMKGVAGEVNLLPYLRASSLRLEISASGVAPGTPWTSDLELDLHLLGKITFP